MAGSAVLLLDDDDDLLGALKEGIDDEGGWDCLAAHNLSELQALERRVSECRLAILDINLGAGLPSGLDAYRWLRQQRFSGRVVFLTGHARSHPLVQEAGRVEGATVRQKPLGLDDLIELLEAA
jgi:ActR/RegA family two-component response regulator